MQPILEVRLRSPQGLVIQTVDTYIRCQATRKRNDPGRLSLVLPHTFNRRLRRSLQKVGTKSAKRKLKRLSGRERRFKSNTNHIISKRLVAKAKDTRQDLALEDLTGIRERTEPTVRKTQRSRHSKWAFGELRQYIAYKAALAGVRLHLVDPRNTSRACHACGCIDKRNRPDQATFKCVACGHSSNADCNAARNIRARALVNAPMVAPLSVAVTSQPL